MKVTVQKARNGEETALVEGHFLHSNYAPVKEAERFVENISISYNPSFIIITEPGLSYTADYLRIKYPQAKIGVIRYISAFEKYNASFDFILNYFEHQDFEVYLEKVFSEEEILSIYFLSWPASSQVFPEENKIVWSSIKAAMLRSKTLLITRQYFEKKWFLNSLNFFKYGRNILSFNNTINQDILIISSGPSLIPFIDIIKEKQKNFFIICLSSAISVCLKNQIYPDLCMTTDGGYWAGQHLKALYKNDIPLALPSEAFCPKKLLTKLRLLPLDYGDGISSKLLSLSKIKSKKAYRNGTVSGTALLFAADYSSKNIYFCGLDMACQTGYQHTQPNQLEYNASITDKKLNSKCLRLTKSELTNGSLDIYKNWIINNPLKLHDRKVYRLIENNQKKNSLGWIEDLNKKDFTILLSKLADTNEKFSLDYTINHYQETDLNQIFNFIFEDKNTEIWKKQLFPLDYIQLSHNPLNTEIQIKIDEEWQDLKKQVEKILK